VNLQSSAPQPLWPNTRCSRTAQEKFALDNAFALIEGHRHLMTATEA
jgi:hypothetical protein